MAEHDPAWYADLTGSRDPRYIREFKAANCIEVFAENVVTRKKFVLL